MTADDAQRLSQLTDQGCQLAGKLENCLLDEKAILVERRLTDLEPLLTQKQQVQDELSAVQFQLENLFAELPEARLQKRTVFVERLEQMSPGSKQQLDQFVQTITHCQSLAEENEGVVNLGLAQINASIDALHHSDADPKLYSRDLEPTSRFSPRPRSIA